MNKTGIVVGLESGKAIIEINRGSACGEHCASCGGGCETNQLQLKIDNVLGAKIGDFVMVEAEEKALLKTTFILYTIPLIAFILGIFGGHKIALGMAVDAELVGIISGVLLMALTFLAIKVLGQGKADIIRMKQILNKEDFPVV